MRDRNSTGDQGPLEERLRELVDAWKEISELTGEGLVGVKGDEVLVGLLTREAKSAFLSCSQELQRAMEEYCD